MQTSKKFMCTGFGNPCITSSGRPSICGQMENTKFRYLRMRPSRSDPAIHDLFAEFFAGFEGMLLGLGEFEFRWHKLMPKRLCADGLSKAAVCLLLRQAFATLLNSEYDERTVAPKSILL